MAAKARNIIDALQDRRLLGGLPVFRELSTWSRWLVLAKALYGLAMTSDEEQVFSHHTARAYRRRPDGFPRLVFIGGRQCGKDRFTDSAIVPFEAMRAKPEMDGTDLYLLNVAQDNRSALRTQRMYASAPFERVESLRLMVRNKTADVLTLDNGINLACYPCRPAAVRGVRSRLVNLQEFAFYRNSENQDVSREMLRAITPTLATTQGRLIIMSSPYAASGALYELHRQHFGQDDSDTLVWVATAPEMNPTLSPDYLTRMLADDPDAYRSEVLGEFREGLSLLFDPAQIDGATDAGIVARPPDYGGTYQAAFDGSGGQKDAAALGIARRLPNGQSELAALRVWPAPHNPLTVVADAASLLKAYGLTTCEGDRYAAGFVVEAMRREGITYRPSKMDKTEAYLEFANRLASGQVRLLDHPDLRRQLSSLERRRGTTKDRIDHPRGQHDDAAVAAVFALLAASAAQHVSLGTMRCEWLL
jgi:hypothetical protein